MTFVLAKVERANIVASTLGNKSLHKKRLRRTWRGIMAAVSTSSAIAVISPSISDALGAQFVGVLSLALPFFLIGAPVVAEVSESQSAERMADYAFLIRLGISEIYAALDDPNDPLAEERLKSAIKFTNRIVEYAFREWSEELASLEETREIPDVQEARSPLPLE